jgi:DNA primase
MRFRGREIDAVALWETYCDFPPNMEADGQYLSKVKCPNPEHDTDKRHFQVNVQDGLVHCFAHCGISGTFEHAIATIHGLYDKFKVTEAEDSRDEKRRKQRAWREAAKIILKHHREGAVTPIRAKKRNSSGATQTVSPGALEYDTFIPAFGMEYLEARKISESSVSAWNLGWLPDEKRIAIPAADERGVVRFLIKRGVTPRQQPKYLYTEGYPKTHLLFGAGQIDLGMVHSHGLIIVEGSLDAIRLHQHGLRNTVAILGTGISEHQRQVIARIKPRKIFLMFDKDSAGVHNIEIASQRLRKYPMFVCRYPKGKSDPAELTKKEAYRVIDRSIPVFRFLHDNGLNAIRTMKGKEHSFG